MIAKLNISSVKREKLFLIETNTGFTFNKKSIDQEIISITKAFTSNPPVSAEKILKPSPTSILYRIRLENGLILMIRGAPIASSNLISAQCELIKLLSSNMFIEPLRTKENKWIFVSKKNAWMAYTYIHGSIYDGNNCDLDTLLNALINFESSISLVSKKLPDRYKKHIPIQKHRVSEWFSFYEELLDRPLIVFKDIGIELSDLSINFLKSNRAYILGLVAESMELIMNSKPDLIHNDINHANIIVKKNKPVFLDIEDIIFEIPEISVTHALFKVLRHRIYQKKSDVEEASLEIAKYIPKLCAEGYNIVNKKTFFLYGSARILSDIYTICMKVIEDNNSDLVYDLEKKIQNLIELNLIIWPEYELRT
mgnify:CR=1 FL=1